MALFDSVVDRILNKDKYRDQNKRATSGQERQERIGTQDQSRIGETTGTNKRTGETTGTTDRSTTDVSSVTGTNQKRIAELVEQLPAQTRNILSNTIGSLGGNLDQSGARIGGLVDNLVSAGRARAVQDFERGELSQILGQAQGIGSLDNTTSQLLLQRGAEGLATRLAGFEADTRLAGEQLRQQTVERDIGNLLGLIDAERGALTSRTGTIDDILQQQSRSQSDTTERQNILQSIVDQSNQQVAESSIADIFDLVNRDYAEGVNTGQPDLPGGATSRNAVTPTGPTTEGTGGGADVTDPVQEKSAPIENIIDKLVTDDGTSTDLVQENPGIIIGTIKANGDVWDGTRWISAAEDYARRHPPKPSERPYAGAEWRWNGRNWVVHDVGAGR